jgi:hypothetical protein
MEEQPSVESRDTSAEVSRGSKALHYAKRLGIVVFASLVTAALYALVFGSPGLGGFSDGLFIIGALLLLVGLLPLVADIFGRSTASFKDKTFEDVLGEQRERVQRSDSITYLFGAGGIIVILLSFVVAFSVR